MVIKRRNFIQAVTLGVATVMTGVGSPSSPNGPALPGTKPLTVNMPAPDGKYAFFVDGRKQLIRIANEKGHLMIPEHSCVIEYTAEDGTSQLSVYIDQNTSESFLLPGHSSWEVEPEGEFGWGAEILGNPIKEGKIVTRITGPGTSSPTVEIVDIQGRTLVKEQVKKSKSSEEYMFDVQRFAKGIMLVKISCDGFNKTLKVLH
jgi:RNase P/RNase MRP subunit p29